MRCNYEQRRFQDRFRSNNTYRGKPRYDSNYRGSYRHNMRGNQRYRTQNNSNRWRNFRNQNYDRNRSRSYERQNRDRRDDRGISNSRSISGSRGTTNRDKIRCFKCKEYEYLVRGCPMAQAN